MRLGTLPWVRGFPPLPSPSDPSPNGVRGGREGRFRKRTSRRSSASVAWKGPAVAPLAAGVETPAGQPPDPSPGAAGGPLRKGAGDGWDGRSAAIGFKRVQGQL